MTKPSSYLSQRKSWTVNGEQVAEKPSTYGLALPSCGLAGVDDRCSWCRYLIYSRPSVAGSCKEQPRQLGQIVGGHRQCELDTDTLQSKQHRLADGADLFAPTERFLDELAFSLAHLVAGMSRGAPIDGRVAGLGCHVRRDAHPSELRNEATIVIALVDTERDAPC